MENDIYMVWIQTNANRLISHDTLTLEVRCQNTKWSWMYYEQVVLNRFSPEIPLWSGRINRSQSYAAPPKQLRYKKGVRLRRRSRLGPAKALQKLKKQWKLPMRTRAWVLCNDTPRGAPLGAPSPPQEKRSHSAFHRLCSWRRSRWARIDTRSRPAAHGV